MSRVLSGIDNLICVVHVTDRTITQTARLGHVLCSKRIVVRSPEQFVSFAETIMRAQVSIDADGKMIYR